MNLLYGINYAIFAAFFTLFIIEIGIAITFLSPPTKDRDKIRKYLNPIWEITGTFAVFYVINFVATFPSSLWIISSLYTVPLLVAAMLFIFRNAFIAYSSYTGDKKRDSAYLKVYSVATIVTAFLIACVLGTAVSGIGVTQTATISLLSLIFSPFNILIFIAIVLIGIFVTAVFFNNKSGKKFGINCGFFGILLVFLAIYGYTPYMLWNLVSNLSFFFYIILLLLATSIVSFRNDKYAPHVAIVWLFYSLMFFGRLQYPYWFGGSVNALSYLVNQTTGQYTAWISVFGGLFVAVALGYFIYAVYKKKGGKY